MDDRTRDRIIELCRQMRGHTVENGCTPGEAAKFAAKVAEWIERYQIEEAELRAKDGASADPADIDVSHNTIRTGKKVFNPGTTQVVQGLSLGMCCKVILIYKGGEAVYGVIGDTLDADYVCQVATTLVPALQMMAKLEGAEHGYEKAGLIRWTNQYLTGAGMEIRRRLEAERKDRSDSREVEHRLASTAITLVTGETLATAKRAAVAEVFREMYPCTKTQRSRTTYDHTANERGREAGKRVGLHIGIEQHTKE